jgi:hypothetical protein
MKIFNTQIKSVYVPCHGYMYRCYKLAGKKKGNVAYVDSILEVIEFILE